MIDFYASERQYLDHIAPIWFALKSSVRGRFYTSRQSAPRAAQLGVTPELIATPSTDNDPIVVASYQDLRQVVRINPYRPIAFVEHGAGQTYVVDHNGDPINHPSYSGGAERGAVALFLCPNQQVADRNLAIYPNAKAEVIGCPKMDPWHRSPRAVQHPPVIAVSFHANVNTTPESRWAFPHYRDAIIGLSHRFKVIGHGHPRAIDYLERHLYRLAGIEVVRNFDDVLDRASIYVCDNSSTLYEFASTDRPVVVLNAPWYRRDVEHGLRFWEHAGVGVEVDAPADLIGAIRTALNDSPEQRRLRREAVDAVYAVRDGRAAIRGAWALSSLVQAVPAAPAKRRDRRVNPFGPRAAKGSPETMQLPTDRFRRLGATPELLTEINARWQELPLEFRKGVLDEIHNSTDDALRARMDDMLVEMSDALTGVVHGD